MASTSRRKFAQAKSLAGAATISLTCGARFSTLKATLSTCLSRVKDSPHASWEAAATKHTPRMRFCTTPWHSEHYPAQCTKHHNQRAIIPIAHTITMNKSEETFPSLQNQQNNRQNQMKSPKLKETADKSKRPPTRSRAAKATLRSSSKSRRSL